jgi:pimeloyl-ACP methyl ester carboxylesterase
MKSRNGATLACLFVLTVGCASRVEPRDGATAIDVAMGVPRWRASPVSPPMPLPDVEGWVPVSDGSRLYYAVFHSGGGAPVLLLHGGLGSSDVWGAEVERLRARHEVIVMDTRGHGRSTRSSAPLSYALMTADVIGVLDTLHVPRTSVVGWSDGGIVGLLLAIDHPQRVDRLVTFGANFDHSGYVTTPPDSITVRLGAQFRASAEAAYRRISPTPDSFPALSRAVGAMYSLEPAITPAQLGRIHASTVIVQGEYEQFIARAHAERLAALIPGARFVLLPGTSHGGPLQDPDGFHRVVSTLLDP